MSFLNKLNEEELKKIVGDDLTQNEDEKKASVKKRFNPLKPEFKFSRKRGLTEVDNF